MYRNIVISTGFHLIIIIIATLSLPFLIKKPIDLPPIVSIELIQITDKTSIPFAPKAKKIIEKIKKEEKERVVLMTTKASASYSNFRFKVTDTILFGRESAGVPKKIHKMVNNRLKIPLSFKKRSFNLSSSVAITLAESLRQNKLI